MTTRRKFIMNSVLVGSVFPMVAESFTTPTTDDFSKNWKEVKTGKGFYYAGIFETPIQEGEKVKDLVQYTSYVLQKEKQLDGCTVSVMGEIFVVIDGRYCRVTGLDELGEDNA